jgi:hypothetical protein
LGVVVSVSHPRMWETKIRSWVRLAWT